MFKKFLFLLFLFLLTKNFIIFSQDEITFQLHIKENKTFFSVTGNNSNFEKPIEELLTKNNIKECFFKKINSDLINFTYKEKDSTCSFDFDYSGNIFFKYDNLETNYQQKQGWNFKTFGKITNSQNNALLFYKIGIQAREFHNFGFIKSYWGTFSQDYLFNIGVLHFGDKSDFFAKEIYSEYMLEIKDNVAPNYQKGVVEDYGLFLSKNGLIINNLTYKAHGLMDVGANLILKNASIENYGTCNAQAEICGSINHIINYGDLFINTLEDNTSIKNFSNNGLVFFDGKSSLNVDNIFDNQNSIYSNSDLSFSCKKVPKKIGLVCTDGNIKSAVEEIMNEEMNSLYLKNSQFITKQKIFLKKKLTTKHFLNTITSHYKVGQYGCRTFSHTTETGYVLQRTETEEKLIELDGHNAPSALEEHKALANAKKQFLNSLKKRLKDLLKRFACTGSNKMILNDAIRKGLKEAGFSDDELNDFFDDSEINHILDGIAAFDEMDMQERIEFFLQEKTSNEYLMNFLKKPVENKFSVWNWVKENSYELVSSLADFANIARAVVRNNPTVNLVSASLNASKAILKPCNNSFSSNTINVLSKLRDFYKAKREKNNNYDLFQQYNQNVSHLESHHKQKLPSGLTGREWIPPKKALEKIPESLPIKRITTGKGAGMKWSDKLDNKASNVIRIMQAKSDSKFPAQRSDYVKITSEGKVVLRDGTKVNSVKGQRATDLPEAHIPLSEWLNWQTPWSPK